VGEDEAALSAAAIVFWSADDPNGGDADRRCERTQVRGKHLHDNVNVFWLPYGVVSKDTRSEVNIVLRPVRVKFGTFFEH
jgi:hypothetical protein